MKPASVLKGLVATSLLAAACLATADSKVVLHVTQSVVTSEKSRQTAFDNTAYFKGRLLRLDTKMESATYDPRTDTITTWFPKRKTFKTDSLNRRLRSLSRFDTEHLVGATGALRPTGKTKRIAGRKCKGYKGSITMTFHDDMIKGPITQTVDIEEWVDPSVSVDPKPLFNLYAAGVLITMYLTPPSHRPVADAIYGVKGLPMSLRIVDHFPKYPGVKHSASATIEATVTSYLQGPLPASVFQVPAGYTEVKR